jgi:hypothetical protein
MELRVELPGLEPELHVMHPAHTGMQAAHIRMKAERTGSLAQQLPLPLP